VIGCLANIRSMFTGADRSSFLAVLREDAPALRIFPRQIIDVPTGYAQFRVRSYGRPARWRNGHTRHPPLDRDARGGHFAALAAAGGVAAEVRESSGRCGVLRASDGGDHRAAYSRDGLPCCSRRRFLGVAVTAGAIASECWRAIRRRRIRHGDGGCSGRASVLSLLAQDYDGNFRIVLVDDRAPTEPPKRIAQQAVAAGPRNGEDLPREACYAGGTGKLWAMSQGT